MQIPRAVERGVRLEPNARATRIYDDRSMDVVVRPAPPGSHPGSLEPGEYEVRARKIVLSAGCPGSPALLMGSEDFNRLAGLGRYVTLHPTTTTYGIHPQEVNGHRGPVHPVEAALSDKSTRVQDLVLVRGQRGHFPLSVPRLDQSVAKLAAGLDEEGA